MMGQAAGQEVGCGSGCHCWATFQSNKKRIKNGTSLDVEETRAIMAKQEENHGELVTKADYGRNEKEKTGVEVENAVLKVNKAVALRGVSR